MSPLVSIIMGSASDLPVMEKSFECLNSLQVPFDVHILSAHRAPESVEAYAKSLKGRGVKVVIAAAGLSAALPGVVASHTNLPVIGVPMRGMLDGLDALLSIVQMPSGVPVATVGVNQSLNAALLALKIIAVNDPSMEAKLAEYSSRMEGKIEQDSRAAAAISYEYKTN